MKQDKKNINLILALANIEIEELAIEGQVQNAFNLKVDALEISKNSKNKKTNWFSRNGEAQTIDITKGIQGIFPSYARWI